MKPGIIYRGAFSDVQADSDNQLDEQDCIVEIMDHGTLIEDSATEEEIIMEMAGEPVRFITTNNDEDKFYPLLALQAEVKVLTDDKVNIDTFAGGEDNRWEVKVYIAGELVFNGWLLLDGLEMEFMPDPNDLLLVAVDNLGVLRDIPLTDNQTPFLASDAAFVTGPNQIGTLEGPVYFKAGARIKVSGSTLNDGVYTITSVINSSPTITLNILETLVTEIATNILFEYVGEDIMMTGYNRIMDYIVNALRKTNLSLPIKVIMNLREEDSAPFTASDAAFVTGPNQIGTFEGPSYFRAGKRIKVTGSTNNDGIYTITSVINSSPTITLNIAETLTTEIATNITFQDADPHFYDAIYLEAKTFEGSEVGSSINAYEALARIFGEHVRCFQHWGQWWIVAIDELDNNDLLVANFDEDGVFLGFEDPTTFNKNIGLDNNESIQFINEDAIVLPTRPHKFIKETFNLITPKEIICNIDFSRGNKIADFSGYSTFELEDWLVNKDFPTGGTPASTAFIKKEFNDLDVEEARYAVLTPEASTSESNIQACAIPVGQNDRFEFGFDWRFSADVSDTGPYTRRVAIIRIVGDDGTYWTLDDDGKWYASNVTWTVNLKILQQTIQTADDEREIHSYSIFPERIPVSGNMYIHLLSESVSRYNVDVYFSNLSLNYHFYLGDAYRPIIAQYHKVSTTINNNVKRDKEVFISDSPRKIFKGTLTKYDEDLDDYVLTGKFYKANVYPNSTPLDFEFKTFGEWQAWWVWNQYRLCNREFDFTAQGLDTNKLIDTLPNPVALLHKYLLTDSDPSTTKRQFMLLHHEANVHLGEWEGYLSEVYNEAEGKEGDVVTTNFIGSWWVLVYNIGAGDVTVYYLSIQVSNPQPIPYGWYKQNTPSVPPYPADIDMDDFTFVGQGESDLFADNGITMSDVVSFTYSGSDSATSQSVASYVSDHEFKYVQE